MPSILMVIREPYADGNRSEDLSVFHFPTCKNNVIFDYFGVWRTYTVSFTHGCVYDDNYVNGHVTLVSGKEDTMPPPGYTPDTLHTTTRCSMYTMHIILLTDGSLDAVLASFLFVCGDNGISGGWVSRRNFLHSVLKHTTEDKQWKQASRIGINRKILVMIKTVFLSSCSTVELTSSEEA